MSSQNFQYFENYHENISNSNISVICNTFTRTSVQLKTTGHGLN